MPGVSSRTTIACWALLSALALAASAPESPGQFSPTLDLQYRLNLEHPARHLMQVEIAASKVAEPALDFVMPAWSPGRYAMYDFAKNVQEFQAFGAEGQPLAWTKLDKQTWHVQTEGARRKVQVRYRVYANNLSGTFSQFDTSHANVNGASAFMYVAGHKQDPLRLTVEAPADWKVISGFSESTEQRTFQASNYDRLVDTPLEISPECALEEFKEGGKVFRVAVHTYAGNDTLLPELLDKLRRIVRSEMAAMPEPDFEDYTFIFHFAPDTPWEDGMEHFNSTQIITRGVLERPAVEKALETAAHEFFHLWNVKRLRPAALGPFDYTREIYTRSLWFAEGVTSYCAYLYLLRSGSWSRQEFLGQLGEEIRQFESDPGRNLMSAEDSSFHAWFYDRPPRMQETNFANTTVSYYNVGALLGMLLDLEVRSRTQGQKSLVDVLTAMYQKFYQAPTNTYYGPGRGYEEEDIVEALDAVTGSDFKPFFDSYVRGTRPFPYRETLALAGFQLQVSTAPNAPPSLGAFTDREPSGLRIVRVSPGSPAERAGLARGDLLLALDELDLQTAELPDRLKRYSPGARVPFTLERHGRKETVIVTLDPPEPDRFSIEELPSPTPQQVTVRRGWLNSKK